MALIAPLEFATSGPGELGAVLELAAPATPPVAAGALVDGAGVPDLVCAPSPT